MRNAYYQLMNYIDMTQTQDVFYYAAKTILENIEKIPQLSITQVADLCFASTATISRLIRRLNYPSYNDFKQDVIFSIEELTNGEPLHYAKEPITSFATVSYTKLKDDFYESIKNNLTFTHHALHAREIEEIVNDIDAAKQVVFLGFNFSQMVSSQLRSTLAAYHKNTIAKTSEKLQLSSLRDVTKDDLIILTTITGNYFRFKEEAAELFKKSPAKKIVITQAKDLARKFNADKIIVVGDENISYIGKFSIMMIYEMIEMFYAAKHSQDVISID